MNVATLRKDDFAPVEPVAAPVEIVRPAAPAAERKLPLAIKLPTGKAAFESAWPPLLGIAVFLIL